QGDDRGEHRPARDGARHRARHAGVDLSPGPEAEDRAPRRLANPLVSRVPESQHHHRHQRKGRPRRLQARAAEPRAPAEARSARRGADLLPPSPRPAGARLSAPGLRAGRPEIAGRGVAPARCPAEDRPAMSRLADKVAIVTGTSPNIGGGIAQGLADEGARVACVDVAEDNAQQCADWIAARGGTSLGIACDITDEGQVEAMVARVREAYGGVDILVNNAGILGGTSVLEMPLDRWSRQVAVNLTGTFLCTKHVARSMVADGRRGSIIVIISTARPQGQAGENCRYA